MKIGIISESPSLTTGFGIVCNQMVQGLAQAGHEIACFGIRAFGETFDRSKYPCKIWAIGKQDSLPNMATFLQYEKPDLLIINYDITTLSFLVNAFKTILKWHKPIITQILSDGLPISHESLVTLSTLSANVTPTHAVGNYLKQLGISEVVVAPYGVEPNIFRPLDNREQLRQQAGLEGKFVIGVFGRNAERKQQPRVMMAISHLKKMGKASDMILYLHCQTKDEPALGGWNLKEIAKELEIDELVIFPHEQFDHQLGVPQFESKAELAQSYIDTSLLKPKMPDRYTYVERMNCCNMVVNASYCGGFELALIEAQSCGVPVAVTNDGSNMLEVLGEGGLLLNPVDVGIWRTGARQHFVSPVTISEAILAVKEDVNLQNELTRKGKENALKYSWDSFRDTIVRTVQNI